MNNPLKKKYGLKKMETQKFRKSKKQKNLLYNSHVFESRKAKKANTNITNLLAKSRNSNQLKLSNVSKKGKNLIKKKKLLTNPKHNQNINSKKTKVND